MPGALSIDNFVPSSSARSNKYGNNPSINMSFGDVKTPGGLAKLNSYLETRSYLEGYVPSTADVAVQEAVGKEPDAAKFPHAARWYRQVASYDAAAKKAFGKVGADKFIKGGAAAAAADDDDVDLVSDVT